MKKIISLPMMLLLALVASNASALFNDSCGEGPLEPSHWFIKPKIGVAPSIFASHRAHQLFVVPFAALDPALCSQETPQCNVLNFANVLQEGPCIPKFSDIFSQGVLHVGVEVGYNICDRSVCFLEFIYNRASGDNVCLDPFITNKANTGCTENCESDCSVSCKTDCCPTGDTLSAFASVRDNYDDYQAYGGYIGGRHFTNRFWCDSTAFWYGYKVGLLHRNQVDACTNIVYNLGDDCDCNEDTTVEQTLNRAIFCKSNSVSGGLQAGFDYCYSDCLSFQLGFEVVASCGLRGNKNHPIDINALTCDTDTPLRDCLALPSNIVICNTGAVINFPIWFGLRWEFGCCDPCADRSN